MHGVYLLPKSKIETRILTKTDRCYDIASCSTTQRQAVVQINTVAKYGLLIIHKPYTLYYVLIIANNAHHKVLYNYCCPIIEQENKSIWECFLILGIIKKLRAVYLLLGQCLWLLLIRFIILGVIFWLLLAPIWLTQGH